MRQLLAINGSYRSGGVMDQAIDVAVQAATLAGTRVEVVHLRDYPIEFCRNCRECTQQPGNTPGTCVQNDSMQALVDKIEAADGYILASPTNFYSVTAVFKRFMERLIVYAYWPKGDAAPTFRKQHATKKAILLASCAAPSLLGRLFFTTLKQLNMTAKVIGARPVGSAFIGRTSAQARPPCPRRRKNGCRSWRPKLM